MYKLAMRKHAKNRALQRYDLNVNKQVRRDILAVIFSGKAVCLKKGFAGRRIMQVTYDQKQYLIVYDRYKKEIVTFLPSDHVI